MTRYFYGVALPTKKIKRAAELEQYGPPISTRRWLTASILVQSHCDKVALRKAGI